MQSKSTRLLFIALLIGGSVHAQQNTVTAGGEAAGSGVSKSSKGVFLRRSSRLLGYTKFTE